MQTVIDQYVKAMAQNYKLTDKQEEYTRELLNQRVKQFLKDYEKDVRTLLGEYIDYRARGEVPSPEEAKDFARRAQPLIAVIRQEVLDGNMQWRHILNEDQLKMHDRDLELLHQQLDFYEQSMDRWAEGRVGPRDLGLPDRNRPMNVTRIEDTLGIYLKNFIARYNLDEGQQQTAKSNPA